MANYYYRRKPLPIDGRQSLQWAIATLGSIGVGAANSQVFDLVNRNTGRAHLIQWDGLGLGLAPPLTGSLGHSNYVNFQTPKPVSFHDFDGLWITIRETNSLLYSWTHVSFWGMTVDIADGGWNVPGMGVATGFGKVLFGLGRPSSNEGIPNLIQPWPTAKEEFPGPRDRNRAPADDDGIRIPGDILFAFNNHRLRPGPRTEWALTEVWDRMRRIYEEKDHGFLIDGHTDSVGGLAYNMELSRRRAGTVMTWLRAHAFPRPELLKTRGYGPTEPVTSNDTEEGRAKNRRVEIYSVPIEHWKDW